MKEIYYWSPCLTNIGTLKSTLNSSISLSKYYKNEFKVSIINSCGEWDNYKDELFKSGVNTIDFPIKYFKFLPKNGYLSSRFSSILIFLLSFGPLLYFLKKKSPNYIILHMITSLPLILLLFFKFKSKFILRISGLPKLNIFRKFLWQKISSKLFKVTSPSLDLIKDLIENKIFQKENMFFLPDAILNIKEINKKKLNYKNKYLDVIEKKNYFISAGRLTRQKNFSYLVKEFSKFLKINQNYNLLIFGDGEEKIKLYNIIKKNHAENSIFLVGHTENIYHYMKKSSAFILSSLWEAPGFVLIEAAFSNSFIISSDCKYGPSEFLNKGENGFLFNSNTKNILRDKLVEFDSKKLSLKKKIYYAKKNCKKYTMFHHSLRLKEILT